jgi:3-oxoacyl-[acyl-carrier protein] reductase
MMNILILGGSKGLGEACVKKFARSGHNVIVMSRSFSLNIENVSHLKTDFKDSKALKAAIDKIDNIDILINNSGGPESKPFGEVSADEFLSEIHSHLITAHEVTKKVVQNMKKNKFGRIINIISVTANNPLPNMIVS